MTDRNEALKELGRVVTERRENAGITLETVFDRTRIRPEYLRGIEEGDYTDFPEPVYIKGFIRTYLKVIGAEDLLDDFNALIDRTEHSKSSYRKDHAAVGNVLGNGSSMPEGFKAASHLGLFIVLIAALIGTGIYVWYALNSGGIDLKNLKFFSFSGNGENTITQETLSNDIDINEAVFENVELSDDVLVSEEPEPEPEITPSLEIHAVNDVWLSVSFGDSAPVYRRTLKRGEVMRWDLKETARVLFGRPTAAQVILNGEDLGVVNPRAKKAETYTYSPDGNYRKIK
ncbi:MAG: helix-turn-helix domain-containing protein [Synergistaceae bacterium]|nr:helix-turn-helix domain-containing protein [Synergistaceae bacterium]